MPKTKEETLREKGWEEKDIKKAMDIIESRKVIDKSGSFEAMSRAVYWTALIITIIGNFLIGVVLVPFLLGLAQIQLYIVIATLAIAFGFLFNLLINDIEHVDYKHHIVAGIFIPMMAIITIYVVTSLTNDLSRVTGLKNPHNPLLVSVVYVAAFITPYIIGKIREVIKK